MGNFDLTKQILEKTGCTQRYKQGFSQFRSDSQFSLDKFPSINIMIANMFFPNNLQ